MPKNAQAEIKADYWAIFDVPDTVPAGPDVVTFVRARIDSFAARWRDFYPAASPLPARRPRLTHRLPALPP